MVAKRRRASAYVRFLNGLPPGYIFTTRDLIPFASRSTLDSALCRMVADGTLERLARGVFRFFNPANRKVSVQEIAAIKRKAFGRSMATAATVVEREYLDRLDDRGRELNKPSDVTFVSDGRSSSFISLINRMRINLRSVAPRMKTLGESQAGRMLRDMWLMGNGTVNKTLINHVWLDLHPSQREKVTELKRWLPDWLVQCLPPSSPKILEKLMVRAQKPPVQLKPLKSAKKTSKVENKEGVESSKTSSASKLSDVDDSEKSSVESSLSVESDASASDSSSPVEPRTAPDSSSPVESGTSASDSSSPVESDHSAHKSNNAAESDSSIQKMEGDKSADIEESEIDEDDGPRFHSFTPEEEEEIMRKRRQIWDEWKKNESDDDLEFH